MTLTTPALLFPAISLLFLAYNNRFLALAQLIRTLHAEYAQRQNEAALAQIRNLERRLKLIQIMEFLGVFSFVLCAFCMLIFLLGYEKSSQCLFMVAIVSLMSATALSGVASSDPSGYAAYAALLALMIGAFQLALGLLRL